MAEINAASTSTEAVSHAVFPVEVEPSSVNTDSMNNEIEVVPSTPCTSVTPCASTSEICTQVSSERDELTNMLLLRQLCQSSAFLHSIAKRTNKTKEKKNYAVLRKAGSKELFIAAKSWMLSEDLCLYHSSITDNEVEACVRPRPEWVLTDCEMLAELDSFVEAKNTLQATKRIYSVLSNSDNMEETLPLTNSKRPRVETKNSSYAYDSMELEAVEARKVCLPSKYPTTNFMATVMSPIASTSTQQMPVATSSPIAQLVQQTTKENCELDNKVANELQSIRGEMQSLKGEMHSFKGEMKAELQSLKTLVAQLLSVNKSTCVAAVGSGKSTIDNSQLQFPVTTEEEFTQLEASLKNPKFKESFMMKMVEKLSFNPESSLRAMLNYVMDPKLSSRFTAFGTPKKLALTKCTFYAVITSVIVSKFVSATIFDDDVKKILKKTVKAYFHDIRDRIDKRDSRRRVAVDNKKSDQRISPDTSMDLLDDGEN